MADIPSDPLISFLMRMTGAGGVMELQKTVANLSADARALIALASILESMNETFKESNRLLAEINQKLDRLVG